MRKKILDILPKEPSVPSCEIKEPLVRDKELPTKSNKKGLWFLILLLLILTVMFGFKISRAEIKIWPDTETTVLETELSIDTSIQYLDFKNKVIPGQVFEVEESISRIFSSSGKTLKKAEGVIRLYNAYTTKSEIWLKGTRFVSAEGKLFKSKDRIYVPGAEIKDGKIIPRYIDVPVIAAEFGEDYNIGPSHFSIFVYRGTPRYTKFYGESLESMKGGGESPQVTAEDLTEAEEILTEEAKAKSVRSLREKVGDEFIFLTDISKTEITEKISLAKAGDEMSGFTFKVETKAIALIFKKQEIERFTRDFIVSRLPEQKLLYTESLKIDYTPQLVDWESGKVNLSLKLSCKIYPKTDLQALKRGLMGKTLSETKIFLENQPEFISTEIKFWPFWVKSIPKDLDKIEIKYPIIDVLREI
ncbi:MAG: hypothetical protein ACKKMR_00245 [Candidatus Nealsonbacteria bacterium]